MKRKVIVACAIVAILGIISAGAGFAAEATKVKASEVRIEQFSCVYPSSPAHRLAILAAIFAVISRTALFLLIGCCCCRSSASNPFSNILNILSWIASVIAVILLFAGAVLEGGHVDSYGIITCYVVKPGILAVGAVLSLSSTISGVVAYVSVKRTASSRPEFPLHVDSNGDLEKNIPTTLMI